MSVWMSVWMNDCMNNCMIVWVNEWMNEWLYDFIIVCMNEWMTGCVRDESKISLQYYYIYAHAQICLMAWNRAAKLIQMNYICAYFFVFVYKKEYSMQLFHRQF